MRRPRLQAGLPGGTEDWRRAAGSAEGKRDQT